MHTLLDLSKEHVFYEENITHKRIAASFLYADELFLSILLFYADKPFRSILLGKI